MRAGTTRSLVIVWMLAATYLVSPESALGTGVPSRVNYQGKLTDAVGAPLATGEYSNPSATGFGPQNYAMSIPKELTIAGSGNNCDETLGTVFAPFSAGGQITNGAIWIAANNVTFKDICVDGQRNQDSGTGQEVARGFQAGGTNLAIDEACAQEAQDVLGHRRLVLDEFP